MVQDRLTDKHDELTACTRQGHIEAPRIQDKRLFTRHKVPIVFTLYMVDVLCCALGCVILLWFLKIHEAKQRSLEATRREKAAAETGAMLDRTRATLEETQGRLYSAQQLAESLEKDRDQTRTALTQANSRIADLTKAMSAQSADAKDRLAKKAKELGLTWQRGGVRRKPKRAKENPHAPRYG